MSAEPQAVSLGIKNVLLKMQQNQESRGSISAVPLTPKSFSSGTASATASKFQSFLRSAGRNAANPLFKFGKEPNKLKLFTSSMNGVPKLDINRPYRILVVGDKHVGKSTFIHRYLHNEFMDTFEPTNQIEISMKLLRLSENEELSMLWQNYQKNKLRMFSGDTKNSSASKFLKIRMIAIELWEIPFDLLNTNSRLLVDIFDDADAMILLCSSAHLKSFAFISNWLKQSSQLCSSNNFTFPSVWLVVNGKNESLNSSLQEEDIKESAKAHKCSGSFHISVKLDDGLTDCFSSIVASAVERRLSTPIPNILDQLRNPISSKFLPSPSPANKKK